MKLKLSVWVWSQNHLKLQLQFFAPTLQFTLKFSKSLLINNKSRWSGPQIQVKDPTQTMYYNLHVLSHFLINIFGFSCLHILTRQSLGEFLFLLFLFLFVSSAFCLLLLLTSFYFDQTFHKSFQLGLAWFSLTQLGSAWLSLAQLG